VYQGRSGEPDPSRIRTLRDFGHALTLARLRAGLTVQQVAQATGLPTSTLAEYFAGTRLPLPSQPEVLRGILQACGQSARADGWAGALGRISRPAGSRDRGARSPYRGLASFQPEDAPWFFGREEVTARLVTLAAGERHDIGSPAQITAGVPLVLVGPSGSGKSSVLRAGLIPRLLARRAVPQPAWGAGQEQSLPALFLMFSPGARPFTELARELHLLAGRPTARAGAGDAASTASDLARDLRRDAVAVAEAVSSGPAGRPVIVVDQFEAVFTECQDEDEQDAFIAAICALSGPAIVTLGLRADFYDRALRYPGLASALHARQVVIGPMNREQVRSAILGPARLAGLNVEEGLVELLLRDLAPRGTSPGAPGAAHEVGALPLLSHALLTTWQHSHGKKLTVADYLASGGIKDAIARTAEAVYAELADNQQDLARRLFLRMVRVSDDTPETRSTMRLSELEGWPDGSAASDLLAKFIDARLITTDAGTAQLSHEALLTTWPRLRSWVNSGREDLLIGRRISDEAQAWADAGRDGADLLRGGRLALARDWAASPANHSSLSRLGVEFLDMALSHDQARQQAERNRTRRLYRLTATLTALVIVTLALTGYAFQQRHVATAARDAATTARNDAISREVASEANQVRGRDVSLAAQLSLAAYRIADTADARSSLLDSSGTTASARMLDSAGIAQAVSLSPNHRVLAIAADDGTLRLWDVAHPGGPARLGPSLTPQNTANALYAVAFSPTGHLLATAGTQRAVMLWDVSDPGHPLPLGTPLTGPASTVYSLAFSRNGHVLAAGGADDTVRLWDMTSPARARPLSTLTGPAGPVNSVAFSPDGTMLAAGSDDGKIWLWHLTPQRRPKPTSAPLTGPAPPVASVAFSPDGSILAAGGKDGKVWLWHLIPHHRPVPDRPLTGAANRIYAVGFSPDGTAIAAGSADGTARVWDLATRAVSTIVPHPPIVIALTWDGADHLITAGADGDARFWFLPSPVLRTVGKANGVAFSQRDDLLASASNDLELWNPHTRTRMAARTVSGAVVNAVAFAPRGMILAAGYSNGMAQLWHTAGSLAPLSEPFRASAFGLVESVAFNKGGTLLATAGDDGTVRLWAVSNPARPRLLVARHYTGAEAYSVAFSPDGHLLADGNGDDLTWLLRITNPAHPVRPGSPLRGPSRFVISVAFSPDGHTLAVGSADKTVWLWDTTNPAHPRRLRTRLTGPTGYVYSVAFSPNGHTLAAGDTDGSVWLWNMQTPAPPTLIADLTGISGQVFSVAFSADGQTLAAASNDGTIHLWDTSLRATARAVCARSGHPLTKAESAAYLPGTAYHLPCPSGRPGAKPTPVK